MKDDTDSWDEFVEHVRRDALVKIAGSSAFVALVPDESDVDVKVAVEIGLAILLDKPILAVVMPGREISEHLGRVADVVVHADVDTQEGRDILNREIKAFMDGVRD